MAVLLGLNMKLYRNSGSFATPTWNEVGNVTDLTFNLDLERADVTTRSNNGWRAQVGTLNDGSIEFDMFDDDADTELAAIETAFINRTPTEFAVLNGDVATSGTKGWRLTCAVLSFTRNEPLTEAVSFSVTLAPTLSANAPQQMTIP